MSNDEFQEWCQGQFHKVHSKLDSLDESLRGNGRKGVNQRLCSVESFIAFRKKLEWALAVSIVGLAVLQIWQLVVSRIGNG